LALDTYVSERSKRERGKGSKLFQSINVLIKCIEMEGENNE
jgi:hypothetical protein